MEGQALGSISARARPRKYCGRPTSMVTAVFAGSDVPCSRGDSDPPVDNHACLGQVYPSAGLHHGDLDDGLAERDGAEHVDRDAADPERAVDRLVDHMGKKGSRWSAVLSCTVPRALSRRVGSYRRFPRGR